MKKGGKEGHFSILGRKREATVGRMEGKKESGMRILCFFSWGLESMTTSEGMRSRSTSGSGLSHPDFPCGPASF